MATTTTQVSSEDREFEDVTVAAVTPEAGGGWSIERSDGWSFHVPPESPVVPAIGMPARFYGRGIGFPVRGLALDGRTVFYRTAAEQEAHEHGQRVRKEAADYREWYAKRDEYDRRYDALPELFRRRLDRFRANCVEFRWKYEPYEIAVCETAAAIAAAVPADEFPAFLKGDYAAQAARVPAIDAMGLSGNMFGCACRLAHWFHRHPENVVKEHAAIAVITGCEACGCRHEE